MAADQVALTSKQLDQLRRLAPDHYRVVMASQRHQRRQKRAQAEEPAVESGPEVVIDLENFMDRLTVGDMEDMERATGVPALSMAYFGGNSLNVAGVAALIWVLHRKVDATYTFQQARALPVKALMDVLRAFDVKADEQPAEEDDETGPLGDSALPSA